MNKSKKNVGTFVNVGWGRLIFAHTYEAPQSLADVLLEEKPKQRDIAFYVNDPQLVLGVGPQDLFLDPSTTYRLNLKEWRDETSRNLPIRVNRIQTRKEIDEINRIYLANGMVPLDQETVWQSREDGRFNYFVARAKGVDQILGVALGVDHTLCFDDLFNSCSLWALSVDPQSQVPGVGTVLVSHLASEFAKVGREIMDLSVLPESTAAVKLYESLGFESVPVFALKCRNHINEHLYVPSDVLEGFNPYAAIIIEEALRRGISVQPIDPPRGYFRLGHGNRRITCRESLSDLTSAIAMSRCADKQLTLELLSKEGLHVPDQIVYASDDQAQEFLEKHGRVVVKPLEGEQGAGISVDLRTLDELLAAVAEARTNCATVLLEEFVEGTDLRVVVINKEVVAAAIRKPAEILGTGEHTIEQLLEKVSRRRMAVTGGESEIPLEGETLRCIESAGLKLQDVLDEGRVLQVRRTANLHMGGTIHDVTSDLSATLRDAAVKATATLEIPVVGLDFLVPAVDGGQYFIIEANERPGLANHEPQPTAQRFIDLLFPYTINDPE